MTAPPTGGGQLSDGEIMLHLTKIHEQLTHIQNDIRTRLVDRDVYNAHRDALEMRIRTIEDDRTALRRIAYAALLGVLITITTQAITATS